MNILLYLIKSTALSGVLFGYYWLFLRNRPFHAYNRFYLLTATIASLTLPLLRFPVNLFANGGADASIRLLRIAPGNWEDAITITGTANGHWQPDWYRIALVGYCLISSILLAGFIRSIVYLTRIAHRYPFHRVNGIRCYETREPGTPFSFFRQIFWNGPFDIQRDVHDPVFLHERYHIDQRHSIDRIFFQAVNIACWFNPFYYLMQRELTAIHEFLADEHAVANGDRIAYAEQLLIPDLPRPQAYLSNPLFTKTIKRRIAMLTDNYRLVKNFRTRIIALPMLILLAIAFGFRTPLAGNPSSLLSTPMVVVIDAGHGGTDPGVFSADAKEKDLALSLSKVIERLSPEYNIKVILSRSTDELSGHAKTIQESLVFRTDLATKSNADAFVSIHVNASPAFQKSGTGFLIEIPKSPSSFVSASSVLGSALVNNISKDYAIDTLLHQPDVSVYILQKATVPSLIIECGYLTNAKDLSFIQQKANQEKIARDILKGLIQYQQQKEKTTNRVVIIDGRDTVGVSADTIIIEPRASQNDSTPILTKVETEAEYPGGVSAWVHYLKTHTFYPETAVKAKIQGQVVVEFTVDSVGNLNNIHCDNGPEALRQPSITLVASSGRWIPAIDQGKHVSSWKKQPIIYQLAEK